MPATPINDVRVQCHRGENGLWTVTLSALVHGEYRLQVWRDVDLLRASLGGLVNAFADYHKVGPL
jgi:hypothetical protein